MTNNKYFNELARHLHKLNDEDREEALNFYREYAEDAGIIEYEELTDRFGNPKNLSSKIYAESAKKTLDKDDKDISKAFIIGIIAICSLPVSLPIIGILIGTLITIIALIFAILMIILVFSKVSVSMFVESFSYLVNFNPALWMKTFGGSLILISVTVLLICMFVPFFRFLLKKITIKISNFVERRSKND
ncbi:DUF1700 domain-containing protein [Peptacetobacter hominis]|uniref:DUF1700 domain-containing protein n=1 Tax=Peptacetobacter hominis TaxID=2743610 RepID=A0A544QW17_9FIRM|nr:DUF1700 domain-containing protein [Peptacetobacter hominis]TQQ84874.1 DUF1700 domain-containing protein [Peptacetobacter hominis]